MDPESTYTIALEYFGFGVKRIECQEDSMLKVVIRPHLFKDDQDKFFILAIDHMKLASGFLREGDCWEVKLKKGQCTLICKNYPIIKYVEIIVRPGKSDLYSLKNYANKNNSPTIMSRKKKREFCAMTLNRDDQQPRQQERKVSHCLFKPVEAFSKGTSLSIREQLSCIKTGEESWLDGMSCSQTRRQDINEKTALTDEESTDMNRSVYSEKGRHKKKPKKVVAVQGGRSINQWLHEQRFVWASRKMPDRLTSESECLLLEQRMEVALFLATR